MKRVFTKALSTWKHSTPRKPLVLKGSRQVGKTYILKSWGATAFPRVHYVNFEKHPECGRVFNKDFDVQRIVRDLGIVLRTTIEPMTDLLVMDEIQACPRALTALKYFCEDLPELAICTAGSLLGVILSEESFPVGKVTFLHLHPMSFGEFVLACGEERLLPYIEHFAVDADIPEPIHDQCWDLLKQYYFTGGMPEAVATWIKHSDRPGIAATKTRSIQRNIIASYEQDFAKHAGRINAVHIQALYRNVPMQLAETHDNTTRRFQFSHVMAGKQGFAAWERPLHWLINAGLVIKVAIANSASLPLAHFTKPNLFRLYVHDIGLLACMLDLPREALIEQDYGIAKGFFAENFVAQALRAANSEEILPLTSWQEGTAEIEFVRPMGNGIIPIEVKAGHRTKAKSLARYMELYSPPLAIKISANPLAMDASRRLLHLPLYLADWAARFATANSK